MFEASAVPKDWVDSINNGKVDEVWVPATFLVDVFLRSGVKDPRKIFVVPEAIDVFFYDPRIASPLESLEVIVQTFPKISEKVSEQVLKKKFKFLSVFK